MDGLVWILWGNLIELLKRFSAATSLVARCLSRSSVRMRRVCLCVLTWRRPVAPTLHHPPLDEMRGWFIGGASDSRHHPPGLESRQLFRPVRRIRKAELSIASICREELELTLNLFLSTCIDYWSMTVLPTVNHKLHYPPRLADRRVMLLPYLEQTEAEKIMWNSVGITVLLP